MPSDVQIFRHLRLLGLNESPESFGAHATEWEDLPLDEIIRRMGCSEDAFVIGAFLNHTDTQKQALVGIAGFRRHQGVKTSHCGSVWGVYTEPAYRGRGIAKALMGELIQKARACSGLEKILLSVTSHNKAAHKLYESLNFKTYGLEEHALKIDAKYVDEYLMVLDLRTTL